MSGTDEMNKQKQRNAVNNNNNKYKNTECIKMLNILLQSDTSSKQLDETLKRFIEYYLNYSVSSTMSSSLDSSLMFTTDTNPLSLIDLFCQVPDELANKLFEKIAEFLKQSPIPPHYDNQVNTIEKITFLLVCLAYRKEKEWHNKLLSHPIYSLIVSRITKLNYPVLNEMVTVNISLLFVLLINSSPIQIYHQHLEHTFQTVIHLFKNFEKYIDSRQETTGYNEIIWRSTKWSVRLFFFVCYGLYSNNFIQYIRKKEASLINSNFLNSIIFDLRLHPGLFKDKNDLAEMKSKFQSDSNWSEWRHYCLDPLYTNYNQIIESLLKLDSKITLLPVNLITKTMSLSNLDPHLQQQQLQNNSLTPSVNSPLLKSFSYSITADTPATANNSRFTPQYMNQQSETQTTTPKLLQQSQTNNKPNVFQYPPIITDSNSQQCPIQNLTNEFMRDEPFGCLNRLKSSSDSDLLNRKMIENNQIKSVMIDNNIKPTSNDNSNNITNNSRQSSLFNESIQSMLPDDSLKNASIISDYNLSILQSKKSSTSTFNSPFQQKLNNCDVVSGYYSNNKEQTSIKQQQKQQGTARSSELKQECDHLFLQLVYERHLREKYEADSNQLHIIKIKCKQLTDENRNLKEYLKQLVEQYKNEVEESLSAQNRMELEAYRMEMDVKNCMIENLVNKKRNSEELMEMWREKYEDVKKENEELEKTNSKTIQLLEQEKNVNLRNQVDQKYIKSLQLTLETLRKKLLIMSSYQVNLTATSTNQEMLFNSKKVLSSISGNESNESNRIEVSALPLLSPIYQYQQNMIETLEQKLQEQKDQFDKLLVDKNSQSMELNETKLDLKNKVLSTSCH
jgi:hypothetical protein